MRNFKTEHLEVDPHVFSQKWFLVNSDNLYKHFLFISKNYLNEHLADILMLNI